MNKGIIGAYVGTALSAIGTSIQVDELLRYVSLGITCLGGLITLITQIIAWYKTANSDGKITKEELKEGAEIVKQNVAQIKAQAEELKKEKQNELEGVEEQITALQLRKKEIKNEIRKI